MTISPITNPLVAGAGLDPASQPSNNQSPLQSVADLFHMSTADLMSELKSGKSLADVAKEKGVSTTDLANTIKQDIENKAPANANVDPAKLDAVVNKLINQKGGPGGAHRHHHHGGGGVSSSGTDPSALQSQTQTSTAAGSTIFSLLA
jgi:hypothetical protein